MGFRHADNDLHALVRRLNGRLQHGACFAYSRRHAKEDFQQAAAGTASSLRMEARILSARWLSECVSENMKRGIGMISGLNVGINLMEERSGRK